MMMQAYFTRLPLSQCITRTSSPTSKINHLCFPSTDTAADDEVLTHFTPTKTHHIQWWSTTPTSRYCRYSSPSRTSPFLYPSTHPLMINQKEYLVIFLLFLSVGLIGSGVLLPKPCNEIVVLCCLICLMYSTPFHGASRHPAHFS